MVAGPVAARDLDGGDRRGRLALVVLTCRFRATSFRRGTGEVTRTSSTLSPRRRPSRRTSLFPTFPQMWTHLWVVGLIERRKSQVVLPTDVWTTCCDLLCPQVSDAVWRSTFNDAQAVELTDGVLTIAVPNSLSRDRISGTYESLVLGCLHDAAGETLGLDVRVDGVAGLDDPVDDPFTALLNLDESATDAAARPAPAPGTPAALDDGSDSQPDDDDRYTFEAFVTGPSNRFAHAAALAVAETPGKHYNPLFIYGDAGLGKTHLLQAISHYVRENYPGATVRYVSSETFLSEFVDAVRAGEGKAEQFKRRYRDVQVLLVDDIQFIERWKETQEEFFHTFNALHQANRQIVLSSDRPPDAIGDIENRLRSRFKMGLITDIQRPDLETRLAILRKKAERETTDIPYDVLEFIGTNISDNIRELEGALTRVTAFATLTHEPLTVELAEKVLSDLLGDHKERPLTPQVILEATSEMFGFSIDDLKGKSRQRPLVVARQVAMYVTRELTDLSYPAIAREFGGRDHTTVMHAVDKIGTLMKERRQIYDQVSELMKVVRKGS
jgi:chromosomal replication initiator protein